MSTITTDDTETPGEAETGPFMLVERAVDQLRFMQAAKGLNVLEADLRTLLEADSIDDDAVAYATDAYTSMRDSLIESLDDDDRALATDDVLGIPVVGDGAPFSKLLLAISQATRYIGVTESWPAAKMAMRAQRTQLDAANTQSGAAAGMVGMVGMPGAMGGLGSGPGPAGPGYL